MLNNINISNILFLDIETVSQVYKFEDLDEVKQEMWDVKMRYRQERDGKTAAELYESAAILSEFGKVVCISVGSISEVNGVRSLRLKSFCNDDEKKLLTEFNELVNKHYDRDRHLLCAHNGKEFDFPYLARRLLINGLPLPSILDIAGKKPWEVRHLDTMELWKFGDYKHYTSLNLLTNIFGIPSPKGDISGADVSRVYWENNDLERIATYCEKDVEALAQLFCRYQGKPLIKEERITTV